MGRLLRRAGMLLLALVFLIAAGRVIVIRQQYRISARNYEAAAEQFTAPAVSTGASVGAQPQTAVPAEEAAEDASGETEPEELHIPECAPITVDFEALQAVNSDVIGWIFCEDTVINYPVIHGTDNELYVEHNYRRGYDPSGAIFTDMANSPGFTDANVILYGHHMQDMSMFATLKYWLKQDYYEEHPVMWLLTPEQDYKILLFAGYVTAATSDTYTVFREGGAELTEYLRSAVSQSEFRAEVPLSSKGHYVLLSTCAYSFQDARTVLHGRLAPLDSAAGVPLTAADEK